MSNKNVNLNRTLIVGSAGGVAQAFLSLLESTTIGKSLLQNIETLYLLDKKETLYRPSQVNFVSLPPFKITNAIDLENLIQKYNLTQVIDLSSTDTIDCINVCEKHKVDFLCTSVEEWPSDSPTIPTDEAIEKLMPPLFNSNNFKNSHLVGAGANPGIVNALVEHAIDSFAYRVGVKPTSLDLDLQSILITEKDTSSEIGADYNSSIFPMTWSPAHCLEELFETRSFYVKDDVVHTLNHSPTQKFYSARCGSEMIAGMAVPHEETRTLSGRYPNTEIAFLYEIPAAARRALASSPNRATPQDWQLRKLFPPFVTELTGYDRLGVLLTSRRFGEMWVGFNTDVSLGLKHGTNATLLQVAAGVMAGWKQLGVKKGVHFVEDLNASDFLKATASILGPCQIIFDPGAKALSLEQRAIE